MILQLEGESVLASALFSDVVILFFGVPITFLSWLFFSIWFLNRQNKRYQKINEQLSRVGKRWSIENDSIVDFEFRESVSGQQQYLIMGFIACLFSWMGFFFSIPMWISIARVKSRKEKFILATDLLREDPIESEKILEILDQFKQLR
ncbi:MAG: hypothetical protein RJB66_1987 [Pseudomonadota bacterium]